MAVQVTRIGQLLDAPRNRYPRQACLFGCCTGHGPALGRTAQNDCIVDVQHLYLHTIFQIDLLYISINFIEYQLRE
jgi:hypothetical protein